MKSIVIFFLALLSITNGLAQTECKVSIGYSMNKDLPPSYVFNTNPKIEGATYHWAFSDKFVSDSPGPVHTFTTTGSYVVEVKVVNGSNICYGRLEAKFEGNNPAATILYAKGKVVEKTGCNLVIVLDNNTVIVPAEMMINFALKPGQYVELAYELLDKASECGKVAKIHKIAEIAQTCTIPITYTKGDKPGFYKFKTSEQPTGTTYKWHFSDKTTSDSPTPVHEFKTTGNYVAELVIVKPDGSKCNGRVEARFEGSTTTQVILYAKGKVVEKTGCNLIIALDNNTAIVPAEMMVNFGLKPGQYVELAYELLDKTSECGKVAKIHKIAEIAQTCTIPITFTKGEKTGFYKFKTSEQPAGTTYKWYFSDKTTSDSPTPVHEFKTTGNYVAELVIVKLDGSKCNGRVEARFEGSTTAPVILTAKGKVKKINVSGCDLVIVLENGTTLIPAKITTDFQLKENQYIEFTYEKLVEKVTDCKEGVEIKIITIKEISILPTCKGALSLVLFDPTDNMCNGKAIVKLLNENEAEVTNVKYIWSNGTTGSTVEKLCPDKTYVVQALVEGVCQKNTSFTLMSKPIWRVTTINGINNFKVIDPQEGLQYEWNFGNGVSLKGAEISYEFEKDGVYEVKLTAISGTESSEYTQKIIVLKSADGTSILNKSEISVYPNPAREMLNINFGNPVENELVVEINSMSGQKVISQKLNSAGSGQAHIDIRSLKQGIYFLRISDGRQLITDKKFVKN